MLIFDPAVGVEYASFIFLAVSISTYLCNLCNLLLSFVIALVFKNFSHFHFYPLPILDVKYLKTAIYLKGSLKNNLFSSEMYHAEDFVCLTKRIVMSHTTPMAGGKLLLATTAIYKFMTEKNL